MTSHSNSRWHVLAFSLVGLYAAWLLIGIFPFAPVEGDEQGVINGATAMARDEIDYLDLAYLPAIQPGAYAILVTANRRTGLPIETLFAVGTVAGAVLFVGFASRLLVHVLGLPGWLALAGLLGCQEISAAAYYMNTTALGMWLTFLALWLACRPPDWRTVAGMAVCIAVAGWIRIDCLLPTPAVPLLLWSASRNLRTTIRVTTLVAAAALALVWSLYYASGVSWSDLSGTYAGRGGIQGWWPTVRSMPLLLSPLVCAWLITGVVLLIVRRQWWLLALIAAGCAATLPIYGTSLASTKYFYHLVPFFLVAALSTVTWLLGLFKAASRPLKFAGTVALILLAAVDQMVGLQTSSAEFRRYTPATPLITLATVPGHRRPVHVVLGEGEIIPTTDGFRLRTGAFFAPWVWRREKIAMNAQLARFSERLQATPEMTVYYGGWLPYQMSVRLLRSEGYVFKSRTLTPNSMPFTGEWTRAGHRVRTDYLAYQTSVYFDPARHPDNPTAENTFFIGDLSGPQPITKLADQRQWQPLWPEDLYRFVTFFQRRAPP